MTWAKVYVWLTETSEWGGGRGRLVGSTHGMGTCSLETFMMNWTHASFLWKALTRYWSVLKIFVKPKDKTEKKKFS